MGNYIDAAEVAKIVRKQLKHYFPGIKFGVRTSRYSGGSSIHVDWIDGPTDKAVQAIIDRFEGADFDGMTDCKSYHDSKLNGESVHFANDFIFTDRSYSAAFLARVAGVCQAKYGITTPKILEHETGTAYFGNEGDSYHEPMRAYVSHIAMREAQEMVI